MEVKNFLVLCLIAFVSPLFSQPKEQPPSPVTVTAQEDTVQVLYRKPRLELPDIIIYGKDMLILNRNRPVYEKQIESEAREWKKRLTGRLIGMKVPRFFEGKAKSLRLIHLRAQYGSYNSHRVEFLNRSRIYDVGYTFRLSHLKEGEWVKNSSSQELESDLKIDWSINRISFLSTLKYEEFKFGYYGESDQERGRFTQYSLRQQLFLPDLELEVNASKYRLSPVAQETRIGLSGSYQHRIASFPVSSHIHYIHVGGAGFLDIIQVLVYSFFSPYEWLNESFGLEFTSANHTRKLSPFAKIDLNLLMDFFIHYRSYVEPHTIIEQFRANHYIKNPSPVAEEHLNSLTLGVGHSFNEQIRTQLALNYEKLRNKPFWKYDNSWFLHTIDTEKLAVKLDLMGQILEFMDIDLSLCYRTYSPPVPYLSKFVAEAKVNYETKFGVTFQGVGTYSGKRNTSISELPSYAKFDLKARKRMLRNLIIFGGIANLFNTKYELLSGYPEPGREVYLGAKLLF